MAELEETLDRGGRWDIRVTVYRNGKRVGTADALGVSFDSAAYSVKARLDEHDLDEHIPRNRPTGELKR